MAQRMPLPLPLSHAPVNPDWFYLPSFTFLVPAHPDSPGQSPGGRKKVVVVVVVVTLSRTLASSPNPNVLVAVSKGIQQ